MNPTDQTNRLKELFARPGVKQATQQRAEAEETPVSPEMLKAVRVSFDRYAAEIKESPLSEASKTMYIDFAGCFVRWMYGGFKPGAAPGMLRPRR